MGYSTLAFTPVVQELQRRFGSRRQYERSEGANGGPDSLGDAEIEFLAERDSFYLATTGATGWPYVQHRGGPKGFLRVIDSGTLAFADFRGNRQYVSTGNLLGDNRAALILVDYPRRARLKMLGRVEVVELENAQEWLARVRMPGYHAAIERVFVIQVEGIDWNCPQHITPRYTEEEIRATINEIDIQLGNLKQENERLRRELHRLRAVAGLRKDVGSE
jgi:uncharacterized protein